MELRQGKIKHKTVKYPLLLGANFEQIHLIRAYLLLLGLSSNVQVFTSEAQISAIQDKYPTILCVTKSYSRFGKMKHFISQLLTTL